MMVSFLIIALTSCSTWHYNHSRVQVDKQKNDEPQIEQTQIPQDGNVTTTTAEILNNEQASPELNVAAANQEVSIEKSIPVIEHKTKAIKKSAPTVKEVKGKKEGNFFTRQISKITKLFKVQDVEKSAVTGWVRLMIILFAIGFIMCLIGIFLSVFLHPGFWWLFSFFGGLCILAGFIVLILGLVGIML
jgi:hypothetical protein